MFCVAIAIRAASALGYRHRLVVAVGVQRLQSAEDARHRLRSDARDVVQRLLARQIGARCLSVKLEAPRLRIFRAEPLAREPRPQSPAGAKLCDLFEEADRDVEEKSEARQKAIRVHAARDAVFGVLQRRRDREAHRFGGRCAGLLRMLSDHRQRIPARQRLVGKLDVIGQDAPRARQCKPKEHVIGHAVRQIVGLVRRAGDLGPGILRVALPLRAAAPAT